MGELFGTDGVRGRVNEYPMLPDLALRLGLAAGTLLRRDGSGRGKVVIGKDTRLSGYIFENALTAGFCSSGLDVHLVGPLPTPAIAFITRNMRADLGVVISASHNPFQDNGIKFFDAEGHKLPDAIEARVSAMVLDQGLKWAFPPAGEVGKVKRIGDALGRYIVSIKNSFPPGMGLDGLRVVLDCANGAAYKVAPLALEELGAEVIRLGVSPDGRNINHLCGSLHPEVAAEQVKTSRADLGIALDGDADRVILADERGTVLNGDQIMAICALDMLRRGRLPGGRLAATVMSNLGLEIFMREQGGELVRTRVGDRYVAETMRAQGISLGGEQSGHLIFRDYGTTGDGLLAALQVLRVMRESGKKLSELAGLLRIFPQVILNVSVGKKIPLENCPTLHQAAQDAEKLLQGRGRVLLRYSGTEPLLRIMLEGENENEVRALAEDMAAAACKDLAS
ncbi:MAG: phosphoglucosamine mutase [Deltaproteobacteria bacterium]|jgi:phosphoglucosamine mutase|nr:phosphoglucosamine mutase [Deltaproteobacteria bacterium]